jgi:hypothetical protein
MVEMGQSEADFEEIQLHLAMEIFPQRSVLFTDMLYIDDNWARTALICHRCFVLRPDNRRTVDRCGVLPLVLCFIDEYIVMP